MKPPSRNIIIGLVIGVVVAGAALILALHFNVFHSISRSQTDERLEKARIPLDQATAFEDEAQKLAADGKSAEAEDLRNKAKEKYDEAARLFQAIYDDTKADMSIRLTAAYHVGLIKYARGSADDRTSGAALLKIVMEESTDPIERFEACRVVASWYWDHGDTTSVLGVFANILDDADMRARLTDLLYSIENSPDGQTDIEFFAAHPEFGLASADLTTAQFTERDETYWGRMHFYHTVAEKITAGRTGADAVSALFEWCRRNVVTLAEDEERDIPTPPYQRILAAHGTADERAWVFCALIEALWKYRKDQELYDYDVMVIKVGESTLVSVGYGDEISLYDMDMCILVYGQDGATPASLADVRGQDDFPLNTGLSGVPYPYKSGDIRNGYYFAPFDPRSAAFKQALVLPNPFVPEPLLHRTTGRYRPLYESAVGKTENAARGYFSRKVQEFDYPYNDPDGGVLQLWDVPFEEYQFARLQSIRRSAASAPEIMALDDQKRKRLDDYIRVYDATDNCLRPLLDGREFQFMGSFPRSADWFENEILAHPEKAGNSDVLEDASYYRCLALFDDAVSPAEEEEAAPDAAAKAEEQEDLKDAEAAMTQYLTEFAGGRWTDSVRFHLGMVYERMGRNADARTRYEQVKGSLKFPAKARAARLPSTSP